MFWQIQLAVAVIYGIWNCANISQPSSSEQNIRTVEVIGSYIVLFWTELLKFGHVTFDVGKMKFLCWDVIIKLISESDFFISKRMLFINPHDVVSGKIWSLNTGILGDCKMMWISCEFIHYIQTEKFVYIIKKKSFRLLIF